MPNNHRNSNVNQKDVLMPTVCIKGGNDTQVPIDELADYLRDNADKIETKHRKRRGPCRKGIIE